MTLSGSTRLVNGENNKREIEMKLINVKNIEKLFEVIDSCEGKIELVGSEIRLNLKSKLAQYFGLAQVFSNEESIKELELIAYNQADVNKLMQFMIDGE